MQKQKKTTLTESQVKLKKLLTPIVEGIISEAGSPSTNTQKVMNKILASITDETDYLEPSQEIAVLERVIEFAQSKLASLKRNV